MSAFSLQSSVLHWEDHKGSQVEGKSVLTLSSGTEELPPTPLGGPITARTDPKTPPFAGPEPQLQLKLRWCLLPKAFNSRCANQRWLGQGNSIYTSCVMLAKLLVLSGPSFWSYLPARAWMIKERKTAPKEEMGEVHGAGNPLQVRTLPFTAMPLIHSQNHLPPE